MRNVFIILFLLLILANACTDPKSRSLPDRLYSGSTELGTISNRTSTADSLEIKALIEQGKQIYNSDPDSAQQILKHAIREAIHRGQYCDLGPAFNTLAAAQFNMGKFEQSKYNFLKSLTYFPYFDSGKMYVPLVYMNLANVFVRLESTDSALYFYRKSLALIGDARNSPGLRIGIYNGMATCLIMAELYNQAAYYIQESIKIALTTKSKENLAYCYSVMGSIREKKSPDSAIFYYTKALDLYDTLGSKVHVESMLRFIGNMWVLKEQGDSAEYYYNLSEGVLPQESKNHLTRLVDKGNIYLIRGANAKAVEQYKRAEREMTPTVFAENALIVYRNLSSAYKAMNKELLAYKYQTLYYRLRDSIFNQDKLATINHLNMQFHLAEKDRDLLSKQLMITKQKTKIQRQYLGIAFSVILVLSLLILLYRRKHRIMLVGINAKLAGAEQERLRLAQEIHDGIVSKLTSVKMNFNALPEYEEELSARQFQETLQHLDASISELRQTTHNLHPALLQHVGLFNAITSLVTQINIGGEVQIITKFAGILPSFSARSELHLYRILQELIQNILKHAAATVATLELTGEGDHLTVKIEDNGKGMAQETILDKNSIGLSNIRDRVQLLKGTIHIRSFPNGTLVTLQFSIRSLTEYI